MTRKYRLGGCILLGFTGLMGWIGAIAFTSKTLAQSNIVPDNTLGTESSEVISNYQSSSIEAIFGGAIRGANLFHSFQEFNVSEDRGAYFFSPSINIQNILTRVTGNQQSEILGTLGTFGNSAPNLFLINPNGIIFGPGAGLNVGGSFVATTANALKFGQEGFFSASNPETPSSILTINPSALLFNQITTTSIQNQSVVLAGLDPSRTFIASGLRVPDGKSLLLVGGEIGINGGGLYAFGGRVELGSLASPGTIQLQIDGSNLSLGFPNNATGGSISFRNEASVNVSAAAGGSIILNARDIEILEGSTLQAGIGQGLGSTNSQAGDITLNATGLIKLAQFSGVGNRVNRNATGNSGNINISTGALSLSDGAILSASTNGRGQAGKVSVRATNSVSLTDANISSTVEAGSVGKGGDIDIKAASFSLADGAQLVTLVREGSRTQPAGRGDAGNVNINVTGAVTIASEKEGFTSGIGSFVGRGAIGNGGNITISSGSFSLTNGAQVVASTLSQGLAGQVWIRATDSISLVDAGIFSTVEAGGVGKGGNIDIKGTSLSLTESAQIQTLVREGFGTQPAGRGDAGNVNVEIAGLIAIAGVKNGIASGIGTLVGPGATGNGGNITISANSLSLSSAQISASVFGQGEGGKVSVRVTDSVSLVDFANISSNVEASGVGKGGDIDIKAASLSLRDGGALVALVREASGNQPGGRGDAGNINVDIKNAVTIVGVKDGFASGIANFVGIGAIGNGGNVTISSGSFSLTNGGQLSTSILGQGQAGTIKINAADSVSISGTDAIAGISSGLFTDTFSDSGGNITIDTNKFRLSNGAVLDARTRNIGKGGEIKVNANLVEVLNGGQFITTTSGSGRAGKITVNATDQIIVDGIDVTFSERVNKFDTRVASVDTASGFFVRSSGLGIAGDIEVTSPKLTLNNQGKFIASSTSGDGGNITLNVSDLLLLRRGSQISTNAGTELKGGNGGNININSKYTVAFPEENSDITANAYTGTGGQVKINTSGIFGIEERSQPTNKSDITASSELGIAGVTTINTPDTSALRNSLSELPENIIDTNTLIANSCIARRNARQQNSTFHITGNGGIPERPGDLPLSPFTTGAIQSIPKENESAKLPTRGSWKIGDPIVEPQSVYQLPNGQLVLSRECL